MRGALALACLLVLAGCSAPVADAGATTVPGDTEGATQDPTATGAPDRTTADALSIEVRNGSLPVDADRTFARVQAVLGTDVSPPGYVEVVEEPGGLVPWVEGQRVPRFWRLAGLEPEQALNESQRDRLENGVTTGVGGIRLYLADATPQRVEWLLAHEFVHYAQVRTGWGTDLLRALPRTTDAEVFVRRGVVEGVAVYATDEYIDRHLPEAAPNSALYADLQGDLPPGSPARYTNLAYIAGHEYVADRFDAAADATAVYDSPPATSEQLLHRTDEAPANLSVSVETGEGWRYVGADRMGEAFLRVALENGLSAGRAERAAAGWGNDSLRTFRPAGGGEPGYAWVLRFDDAAAAAEAGDALDDWLSARGERAGEGWRVAGVRAALSHPDDRTVAVQFGPESFVAATGVAAVDGGVRVAAG